MTTPTVLTAERLRELFNYNPSTGIFTRLVSTNRGAKAGDVVGHTKSGRYVKVKIDGANYRIHRLAWLFVHGAWPTDHIDHINGNSFDNRIENLRDVGRDLNMQNQRKARSDNKLGVLGVVRSFGGFRAEIKVCGKKRSLGTFQTPDQAHAAYLDAKRVLHPGNTL